ncbi:MAG: hypothetical protein WAK16_13070 [Candidatus Cybelea sp.]
MPWILRCLATTGLLCSVAACNSSTSSVIPQPPNPSTTTITVDAGTGAPLANEAVTLSTGIANRAATGVIATQKTNSIGQTTFFMLPLSGQLCVSATSDSIFGSYCTTPFPATFTLSFSPSGG